jgi:hypothetical protein
MVQMRGGLRFIAKALKLTRIDSAGKRQNLEGDAPAQRNLLRLIHDSHAAAADLTQQSIIAELTQLLVPKLSLGTSSLTVDAGSFGRSGLLHRSAKPRYSRPRARSIACTQWRDHPVELMVAGQEFDDVSSKFRMRRQECQPVGRCTGLGGLHIAQQDFV